MSAEEERLERFQRHVTITLELDRMVRSHILYEAIALEGMVDQVIAWHFCPNEEKHIWFSSLIFRKGEVTFSKKIEILETILKQFYPDINADMPGLVTRLQNIRKIRNEFAHSELVLDEDKLLEKVPEGIYLRSIKDGKVIEKFFRQEDMNERVKLANNLGMFLLYLYLEVRNRVEGKEHNTLRPILDGFKKMYPNVLTQQATSSTTATAQAGNPEVF
jgi:hypothetical protein